MKMDCIEFSSAGAVRSVNEDSIFSSVKDEYGIFVIADGMGGHSDGEIASRRLVEALKKWWDDFCNEKYEFEKCYEDMKSIISKINDSIYAEYTQKGAVCGTTAAVLFIYSDRYVILNSGDSRIYSRSGRNVVQESKDHVLGVEAVIAGTMTSEEAAKHPDRHKLTAAVGCKKDLKLYAASAPLNKEQFFLCSDGVYKYCSSKDIYTAMKSRDVTAYVTDKVNSNGAGDNFSFISVSIAPSEPSDDLKKILIPMIIVCAVVIISVMSAVRFFADNKGSNDESTESKYQSEEVDLNDENEQSSNITKPSDASDEEKAVDFKEAYAQLKKGNYELAASCFEEIINSHPDNSEAYLGIANSYIALNDFEEAVNWLIKYEYQHDIEIPYYQSFHPEEVQEKKDTETSSAITEPEEAAPVQDQEQFTPEVTDVSAENTIADSEPLITDTDE